MTEIWLGVLALMGLGLVIWVLLGRIKTNPLPSPEFKTVGMWEKKFEFKDSKDYYFVSVVLKENATGQRKFDTLVSASEYNRPRIQEWFPSTTYYNLYFNPWKEGSLSVEDLKAMDIEGLSFVSPFTNLTIDSMKEVE